MKSVISESNLSEFSDYLGSHLGLHFPKERWHDLEKNLLKIANDHHFEDPLSCLRWLMQKPLDQNKAEILACYFTIGETYFFRDQNLFNALKNSIFPNLIKSKRGLSNSIRIWSAGCSTGEEALSIAIMLEILLEDINHWNVTILASDINLNSLKKLKAGVYSEWSLRETPASIKRRFFTKHSKNHYEINSIVKNRITPFYLNLADNTYPSILNNTNAMDLILCRNVLMYYVKEQAERVIINLSRSLVDGGYLALSAVECSFVNNQDLQRIMFENAILFKKVNVKQFVENEIIESEPEFSVIPPTVLPKPSLSTEPSVEKIKQDFFNFSNQGNLVEALSLIDKIIQANKLDEMSYYLKGLILQEMGKSDDAKREFNKSIYLNANFVLPNYALGNLACHLKEWDLAKKHFSIALHLLEKCPPDDIVPGSEGITAKKLMEVIYSSMMGTR
jgi:chemotaxis protein methyltransferase CheR